jgi:adenylate kinase family enzyme
LGIYHKSPQAEALDQMLKTTNDDKITMVIELQVPDKVLEERICERKENNDNYYVKLLHSY